MEVGLVSFGANCAAHPIVDRPAGVYTRVSHYVNWINEMITNGLKDDKV